MFGRVVDAGVELNTLGCVVQTVWNRLPERFPAVVLDAFVIMPNHVHGILVIQDHPPPGPPPDLPATGDTPSAPPNPPPDLPATGDVGAIHELPPKTPTDPPPQGALERRQMLLSKIVGYFKMNTAKQINRIRQTPGVPVWQRNYYERVVRDAAEADALRAYIAGNPSRWIEQAEAGEG